MDNKKNTALVQRIISGDSRAFDFLMNYYYQNLCAYAQSLCGEHNLAEDIVQNVFTNVWINRRKVNPHLSIKSYLYKSIYNEFINQYRKNKSILFLEKKYFESVSLVVEKEHEEIENLIGLINIEIEKLPPKCKEIFLLNKKEGLTHIEISEYLNISIKTVEGHITRAFKILSSKFGEKIQAQLFILFNFHQTKIL